MAKSRAISSPSVAGVGHERLEVVDRAQVGVDGVVAAGGVADRPGAAGVVGSGDERVVAALAVGARRWGGSAAGRRRRSRARPGPGAGGARRRARPTTGGTARTRRRTGRASGSTWRSAGAVRAARPTSVGVAVGSRGDRRRRARPRPGSAVGTSGVGDRGGRVHEADRRSPWPGRRPRRAGAAPSASSLSRSSWPASALRLELVAPRGQGVGPGPHRPRPAARPRRGEVGLPAHAGRVGVDVAHRCLHPAARPRPPPARRPAAPRGRRG